jgi:hypothetical protein
MRDEGNVDPGRESTSPARAAISPGGQAAAKLIDAQELEPSDLRGQLREISRLLAGIPPEPVVAVIHDWSGDLPALEQLRTAIVTAELRRRLWGIRVIVCSASEDVPLLFDGEPVYSLSGPVAAACDCWVLSKPAHGVVEETLASLNVSPSRFGEDGAGDPSAALALADRILDRDFLSQRATFLRAVNMIPRSTGFVLPCFTNREGRESTSQGLQALARAGRLDLVDVPFGTAPTDLAAMVHAADLLVTDSVAVATLSASLDRSVILVSDDPLHQKWADERGIALGGPSDLLTLATDVGGKDIDEVRQYMVTSADLSFDALTNAVFTALGGAVVRSTEARLADLVRRVQVLESVNEGLRRSLLHDRALLSRQLRELRGDDVAVPTNAESPKDWMQRHPRTAAEAEIHIDRLHAEIDQVYATRAFRLSRALQKLYGGARSLLR